MNIMGVRIDAVSRTEAKNRVIDFLQRGSQHTVFTPNPEMIVDAWYDKYFCTVLKSGSLNLCDGKGIELVSRGVLHRIPGIDFMLDVCAVAQNERKSVYLLGSGDRSTVEKTKHALLQGFPQLRIVGTHPGMPIATKPCKNETRLEYDAEENAFVLDQIIEVAPDILFVAFGHGKQEKWIYENLKHLPSIKIAIGVGGAFDILSGKIKRAPRLLRHLGLEWLWRLILEPCRIGRIWKATVWFIYLYFRYG